MNALQIALDDIYFVSGRQLRYEDDECVTDSDGGYYQRAIKIEPNMADSIGLTVTIHDLSTKSIQMAPKQMKLDKHTTDIIHLVGFGSDRFGNGFSDYGLDIYTETSNSLVSHTEIKYIVLQLFDRDIHIKYLPLKEENTFRINYNAQTANLHQIPNMRMSFKQDLEKYYWLFSLNNSSILLKDIAEITALYGITLFDSYIKNANKALKMLSEESQTILPISIIKNVKEQLYDVATMLIPNMKSSEAKKLLYDLIDEKIHVKNIANIAQLYLANLQMNV